MTITTSTFDYPAAVAQARAAADAYYNGFAPTMTDAAYDGLLAEIMQHEVDYSDETIEHGLFDQVAGGVQVASDVPHPTPMLSLDKVKTLDDIEKFLARLTAAANDATLVSIEPKLDGLAIRAVYVDGSLTQVVTRGNGQAGEDITDRVRRANVVIAGLPRVSVGSFELRGELVMSVDDFAVSNANRIATGKTGFANPRNAAAGSVRAETLDYVVAMTFVTYDIIGDAPDTLILSTELPGARLVWTDAPEAASKAIEAFGAQRATYSYPTDGAVIKADNPDVRDYLGAGTRAPKWAVAYKFEAQTGETIIRDILVEVGRTGNLSFTAVFDPVLVDGSTISRASLHNVDLIRDKDIRIGSVATVYKANDIIPQVLSVVNGADTTPWVPPTEDAEGYPYDQRGKFWVSTNPADSTAALIAYAASRDVLDIDGLGREIADALVNDAGVVDLSDLFSLTLNELTSLPLGATVTGGVRRLGEKNAAKLIDQIEKAAAQPLNRIITALGIRMTGRTFGRRLAAHFRSLPALAAATRDDLLAVDGIGPERAEVIHAGLRAQARVIERIILMGVTSTIEDDGSAKPLLDASGAPLTVVVTGAMTGPLASYGRTQMNELIDAKGGRSSGSVSKNTGLLVCGEPGSSKWQKATDLGVRIVTPEEFAEMVGVS